MGDATKIIISDFIATGDSDTYHPKKDLEAFEKTYVQDEKKQHLFLTPFDYYLNILKTCNPAMVPYMSDEQLEQLFQDLHHTYLLLAAKKKRDKALHKKEQLETLERQERDCLQLQKAVQKRLYDKDSIELPRMDENPCRYCCIPFAKWFAKKIHEFSSGKTKVIKEWMGDINEKRLYWVWGGGLISTVLASLPEDFYNDRQARQEVAAPNPYTGALGWILYYARFFINLSLLLKHTIAGPWMSDEEKKKPWTQRFKTQWQQRKFALINDSVWATANLVCYFWLVGNGVKGNAGNALTIGLLAMDLVLGIWRYLEAKAQHEKERRDLEDDLKALRVERGHLEEELKKYLPRSEDYKLIQQQINKTDIQIKQMEKALATCNRDWKYKRISQINDIAYALALLLAFAVLSAPFLPVAAPVLLIMGVVGAAACFVLTLIYSAISAGVEVAKANQVRKETQTELNLLLQQYKEEKDENKKKLLYIEMKDLQAEMEYQKKVYRYQAICLARSVMIDAMIPVVIFAATVFLPLGIGLAVMGLALLVGLLSKVLIDKLAKPKEAEKCEFVEEDYKDFAGLEEPCLQDLTSKTKAEKPESEKGGWITTGLFGRRPQDAGSTSKLGQTVMSV